MKKTPADIESRVLALRDEGKTRKEIAEMCSLPLGTVKKILSRHSKILPMELRQKLAYEAKLRKTPNAMADMRAKLTPEVVAKRSESIAKKYREDGELRQKKGKQSKEWWGSLSEPERRAIKEGRVGFESPRVKSILKTEGASSMQDRTNALATNKGGKLIGTYTHSHDKVEWECAKGHRFLMQPFVVRNGHWCPSCSHVGPSKAQLEIERYVKDILGPKVSVERSDRKELGGKELDVWVPDLRVAFEHDGLYHHSSAMSNYSPNRHYEKFQACRAAGIDLFAMFEDEWLDPDKNKLARKMISWRLNKFSGIRLNARQLKLVRLEHNRQFGDFFENHHLDGHSQASFAYGLFDGDSMVCCASVRTNFQGERELARLATHQDFSVRGGAGRLIKAIKEEIKGPLVSFSNNRLSKGEVYSRLGFDLIAENGPSYWYTDGTVRLWRYSCKRVNDPEILARFPSEKDQALGGVFSRMYLGHGRPLYQIHDYGHMKWVLR